MNRCVNYGLIIYWKTTVEMACMYGLYIIAPAAHGATYHGPCSE